MSDEIKSNEEKESNSISLDREHLGIAGRIANTFIDSPITPLFMAAMLFLGLLGLVFTPRQEDPSRNSNSSQ